MRATLITAASLALALSPSAWALTLGEVDVDSALNQQLSATIPVTGIGPDEQDTLRASIASQQAFERAGLRRDALFDDVKVDLIPGPGADRATIKLLSKGRVSEPFLSFLVEVRWAGGGTIREYTVLLDPPNLARASSSAPRSSGSRSMPKDEGAFTGDDGMVEAIGPEPARRSSAGSTRSASRSGRSYGPVGRQETLWSIAYAQRPSSSVTMDQMQLAIFRANPQAFDGNMNRMLTGVMLQIPDESEIREISPGAAKAEVARQKTSSYGGRSVARRSSYTPRASSTPKASTPKRSRPEPVAETPAPVSESAAEAQASAPEPAPEIAVAQAPGQPAVEAPVLAPETTAAPGTDDAASAGTAMVDPETPPASGAPPATEGGTAPDAGSAAGGVDPETPPGTAAAPPEGENLQMPSIWAEGEQAPATEQQPAPGSAAPPAETGAGLGGVAATVGEFKLQLLGLIAVLAALAGLAIYRRRKQQEAETQPLPTMEFESTNVGDLEQGLPQAPTAVWQGDDAPAPVAGAAAPEEITSTFDFDALLSGTPPAPAARAPAARTTAPAPAPAASAMPATGKTSVMQAQPIPVRETDYLGEAELHIAYGLYDEAAAVLNRGVQENPTRRDLWLKLLEVHAEAKNAPDYVVAADNFRQKAKPSDADWAKVVEKGKELAPDAPLFAAGVKATARTAVTELDLGAAFDLPAAEVAAAPRAAARPAAAGKAETIEFDLSEFDAPKSASPPPAAPGKPAPAPPAAAKGIDLDLAAFDSALSAAAKPEAPPAPAAKAAEPDLTADLDFKIGEAPPPAAAPAADGGIDLGGLTATEAGGDEEASVKLDLARAYLDMGETDMARGLLQEVASSGSAQQKREAQELLTRA